MNDHSEIIATAKRLLKTPCPHGNVNTYPWLLADAVIEMAGKLDALRAGLADCMAHVNIDSITIQTKDREWEDILALWPRTTKPPHESRVPREAPATEEK